MKSNETCMVISFYCAQKQNDKQKQIEADSGGKV